MKLFRKCLDTLCLALKDPLWGDILAQEFDNVHQVIEIFWQHFWPSERVIINYFRGQKSYFDFISDFFGVFVYASALFFSTKGWKWTQKIIFSLCCFIGSQYIYIYIRYTRWFCPPPNFRLLFSTFFQQKTNKQTKIAKKIMRVAWF